MRVTSYWNGAFRAADAVALEDCLRTRFSHGTRTEARRPIARRPRLAKEINNGGLTMRKHKYLTIPAVSLLGVLAAAPAQAGHPMLGVSVSSSYIADTPGERNPERCEMKVILDELPGYIPMISTGGYDFCAQAQRMRIDDEAPAIDSGTVTVLVHRLNRRGRWRKVIRIPNIPVQADVASRCRRSFKDLKAGTTLRWRFDFDGLPPFDYYDGLMLEGAIFTGGMSDLME